MIPDGVLEHLRQAATEPDLRGTPYRLVGLVGQGGMGAIWEVFDSRLDRAVALKVLHCGEDVSEEARVSASLEHPGIAPVYDVGQMEDGRGFYTMRLVRGMALDEYLRPETTLRERLRVWQRVAEAIAFASSLGVSHRDLKPNNVLVGEYGEVVVVDWGIARKTADRGADLPSLARLLAFCLPQNGPKALAAMKAFAYADAESMLVDLARWQDGERVLAYREPWWEQLGRWAGNNQVLLLLLSAYAAVKFFLYFLRSA